MVKYKKVPDDQREEFHHLLHYGFRPHEEEGTYESEDDFWDGVGERRGIYDGDKLAGISSIHDLDTYIRDEWLPMGGISMVATRPEDRHQGYVKTMMTEILVELRERGIILSSLWPFHYPFYNKLGWRVSDQSETYFVSPDDLKFSLGQKKGSFRKISSDQYEEVEALYHDFARDFNLPLKRSEDWWDIRKFNPWNKTGYCYLWEYEGEARGYVMYSPHESSDDSWEKEMEVRELIYQDREAFYQLMRLLYNHGSQVSEIGVPAPFPSRLNMLDLVEDPRSVETELNPGVMVRIVDLEDALSRLRYPEDAEGELTLEVTDPLLESNEGVFTLEFSGETSKCRVKREGTSTGKANFSLSIGSLSQLYTGYLSADQLATANKLDVRKESKLPLLNKAFPSCETFFNDGF